MLGSTGRGGAAVMLALVVLFILYGSFFPFRLREGGGDAVAHLLSTWRSWDRRGDLIANILFYIPLGLFAARLAPRAGPLAAALAGAALSRRRARAVPPRRPRIPPSATSTPARSARCSAACSPWPARCA